MKILLTNIPPEGLELDVSIQFNASDYPGNYEYISEPVAFSGRINRNRSNFLVTGRIRGIWHVQCARCLEPCTISVRDEFRIVLFKKPMKPADPKISLSRSMLDESELLTEFIDLKSVVKEQMVLHLPIKALCSEDCRGLCPDCGMNLNHGSCDCNRKTLNPQFAKLKLLLDK